MQTLEIYANYGVLTAEKRTVYTYGAEHPYATCSDKMTVVVQRAGSYSRTMQGKQ